MYLGFTKDTLQLPRAADRLGSERRSFAAVSGKRTAGLGKQLGCFGLRPRNDGGLLRGARNDSRSKDGELLRCARNDELRAK